MSGGAILFFYGTLMSAFDTAMTRALLPKLEPVGPMHLHGRLFAIETPGLTYPALVPGGAGRVTGEAWRLTERWGRAEQRAMDAYEGHDPDDMQASLFVPRRLAGMQTVTKKDGAESTVLAYVFNQPLPADAIPIEDGDFATWMASRQGVGR